MRRLLLLVALVAIGIAYAHPGLDPFFAGPCWCFR